MDFEILERLPRSPFESAAKKIHSASESIFPFHTDLVRLPNSRRNSASKLPSKETFAPGFTPSFWMRDLGWSILSHHLSAAAPRWKTASPSAVCKRKSPRKRISLVSSSAFPSDWCFPKRTEQLSSLPISFPASYCFLPRNACSDFVESPQLTIVSYQVRWRPP